MGTGIWKTFTVSELFTMPLLPSTEHGLYKSDVYLARLDNQTELCSHLSVSTLQKTNFLKLNGLVCWNPIIINLNGLRPYYCKLYITTHFTRMSTIVKSSWIVGRFIKKKRKRNTQVFVAMHFVFHTKSWFPTQFQMCNCSGINCVDY